jgi:DNA-binding NtrC family response regulator
MLITGQTLFAFVDLKDPFTPGEVAGEELTGPILSLMGARHFNFLFLFCTPQTRENAEATRREVEHRQQDCHVTLHELPVSDPKDYSALMGQLARQVREILRKLPDAENHICVSSGTAAMRAAWFLLTAAGVLPATLLQVGTPADPLFGAANVKEVSLDTHDWRVLRDLIMPREFFAARLLARRGRIPEPEPAAARMPAEEMREFELASLREATGYEAEPISPPFPELEGALQELRIYIGSSALRVAAERVATAAPTNLPILLQGETGTGKELFARLAHRLSPRLERELVSINCAAIPKELVESFLFGHVKGSFTGATRDQEGKFQHAHGGTLFLDEIGELTIEAQAKLLRVLQDGEVESLGSNVVRKIDVRIIAATNRSLLEEVRAGRFREDLYYRLEVVQIQLPPLRERRGEIAHLAVAILRRINQRRQRERQLSKEALRRLEQHNWPGNVRELSNVLERSVLYSQRDVLRPEDLLIVEAAPGQDPLARLPEPDTGFSLEVFLAQAREQLILRALAKCNGNQSAAAEILGLSKQAISKFLKQQADNKG